MDSMLKGLVLAGGKSTRMGEDKAKINWHGKEQQYYLADLLGLFCAEVFISCRQDQQPTIDPDYKIFVDNHADSGPLGAILTAFEKYPDHSWMVTACDLPLLDKQTLNYLNLEKDAAYIATVFKNPINGLPEPLIAIWESASYQFLKNSYQKQQLSLRKVLLTNGAKMIKAPNIDALINANTPEDMISVKEKIRLLNASFMK